jgi:2-oxoglutarate ferredoxin oxidoreductase subunit delta
MGRVVINQDKCKGCLLCVSFCPKNLLKKSVKLNKRGLNFVEFSGRDNFKSESSKDLYGECIGCAQCAIICPDCCIEVHK